MRDFGDVQIVVSSTWRHQLSLAELKNFFADDISDRIIGETPLAPAGVITAVREAEILLWLE